MFMEERKRRKESERVRGEEGERGVEKRVLRIIERGGVADKERGKKRKRRIKRDDKLRKKMREIKIESERKKTMSEKIWQGSKYLR